MSSSDFVTLTTVGSVVESSLIRASLEGAGIAVNVRGEHFASMNAVGGLFGNPILTDIEIQVPRDQLEAAQALLTDAKPVLAGPTSANLGDHVCPVHEQPAKATCDRCGTFLCQSCGTLGDPPLCEDCLKRELEAAPKPRWQKGARKVVAWGYLAMLVFPVAMVIVVWLVLKLDVR